MEYYMHVGKYSLFTNTVLPVSMNMFLHVHLHCNAYYAL